MIFLNNSTIYIYICIRISPQDIIRSRLYMRCGLQYSLILSEFPGDGSSSSHGLSCGSLRAATKPSHLNKISSNHPMTGPAMVNPPQTKYSRNLSRTQRNHPTFSMYKKETWINAQKTSVELLCKKKFLGCTHLWESWTICICCIQNKAETICSFCLFLATEFPLLPSHREQKWKRSIRPNCNGFSECQNDFL